MTTTEVKQIVLSWLDYQDHDHTLPGHMGPERIEHFSRKMAEPTHAEPKPAELTADDFEPIYERSLGCNNCARRKMECDEKINAVMQELHKRYGHCQKKEFVYGLKEAKP